MQKINGNNDNEDYLIKENSKYICYFKINKSDNWIVFDENYKLGELKDSTCAFDFKGVSVLIYSKINEE